MLNHFHIQHVTSLIYPILQLFSLFILVYQQKSECYHRKTPGFRRTILNRHDAYTATPYIISNVIAMSSTWVVIISFAFSVPIFSIQFYFISIECNVHFWICTLFSFMALGPVRIQSRRRYICAFWNVENKSDSISIPGRYFAHIFAISNRIYQIPMDFSTRISC